MIDEKNLMTFLTEQYDGEKEEWNETDDETAYGAMHAYSDALEYVMGCPKVGEWIPCEERLPEPYETVLATGKMEKDQEPLVYMACVNGKGEWNLLGVRNPENYITSAWQPLPEPWEGE